MTKFQQKILSSLVLKNSLSLLIKNTIISSVNLIKSKPQSIALIKILKHQRKSLNKKFIITFSNSTSASMTLTPGLPTKRIPLKIGKESISANILSKLQRDLGKLPDVIPICLPKAVLFLLCTIKKTTIFISQRKRLLR